MTISTDVIMAEDLLDWIEQADPLSEICRTPRCGAPVNAPCVDVVNDADEVRAPHIGRVVAAKAARVERLGERVAQLRAARAERCPHVGHEDEHCPCVDNVLPEGPPDVSWAMLADVSKSEPS